jgi:uncharacterized protein (DUF302 family)
MSHDDGIVTKSVPLSVNAAVARFTEILEARRVTVFAVIDQAAAAHRAGLELRPTTLVVFGNPAAGTPVMDAVPLTALDLPLKVLIWDEEGQTKVSYRDPVALAVALGTDAELAGKLGVIGALTDALAGG